MGGCSTPVSAYAEIKGQNLYFKGNIFSPDGKRKVEIEKEVSVFEGDTLGADCARQVLEKGGKEINEMIREQMIKSSTA